MPNNLDAFKSMWRWILATCFIFSFILGVSLITLPFSVSSAGFWPSVIALFFSWIYILFTGFYYLETTLANPSGSNVFSFSRRYTGVIGSWISSTIFIIVHYCGLIYLFFLLGPLITEMLHRNDVFLNRQSVLIALMIIFSGSVALGFRFTILLNFVLTLLSLFMIYICLSKGFSAHITSEIQKFHLTFLFMVFPTLVNSLFYSTFIPTIAPYLKNNIKSLQTCILTAVTLNAVILLTWLWITVASSSPSTGRLIELNPEQINFTNLYKVPVIGKGLPFLLSLNIATLTLGIATILTDFFFDLLRISLDKQKKYQRLLISLMIFIPPIVLNIYPNQLLYSASLYITDIGTLYLSGLFPILCVWPLRYFYKDKAPRLVPGGKIMMLILAVVSCFIFYLVGLEIFYQRTVA